MQIGALARRAGVSPRALRYYEEKGLLVPGRTAGGYRVYTEEHVESVRRIRILLAAGLNSDMVREILPCMVNVRRTFLFTGVVTVGRHLGKRYGNHLRHQLRRQRHRSR
ncbi:MerR family transcriptional regulator [Nonomuraea sp. KM88]|uniref:MerR family transcriptional regulator n=1 Tax=Nonomuraea sp. KM88 TaxID=3457427 RepID=UPI003FCD18C9